MDRLFRENPVTQIGGFRLDVGLPEGQMGNSEVGHTNIGAGRIVYQELTRITKAIQDGDFFENPALLKAVRQAKQTGAALHLLGLLSDGGVHSHNRHLYALLELAKREGLERVYVHAILDGRDVPSFFGQTVCGRMPGGNPAHRHRENRHRDGPVLRYGPRQPLDRVQKAYDAMVLGRGIPAASAAQAVEQSYAHNVTDEFVEPAVCCEQAAIRPGDSVIFFNFRPDRAREITRSLVDPDFAGFPREAGFFPLCFVCMTQYDAAMPGVEVAFAPQSLKNTLAEPSPKRA